MLNIPKEPTAMEQNLFSTIQEITSKDCLVSETEEAIQQEVVLPILYTVGWNIFKRDEVYPQYHVDTGRVDYALQNINTAKVLVFVEVKRGGEELTQHERQLMNYAFQQSVRLAIFYHF